MILKCFKHLVYAPILILRYAFKPTTAAQEDFDIALAALLSIDEP